MVRCCGPQLGPHGRGQRAVHGSHCASRRLSRREDVSCQRNAALLFAYIDASMELLREQGRPGYERLSRNNFVARLARRQSFVGHVVVSGGLWPDARNGHWLGAVQPGRLAAPAPRRSARTQSAHTMLGVRTRAAEHSVPTLPCSSSARAGETDAMLRRRVEVQVIVDGDVDQALRRHSHV